VPAFERIAELRIREAIEEGKLENLPNAGRALDLEWYFALPGHVRLGYGLLKSSDCAPIEVELMKEIAEMEETLVGKTDLEERQTLLRRIRDHRIRVSLLAERRRRSS